MAEVEFRDPTIKLFGKTIPLSLNHVPASADYDDDSKRRDTQKENSREELGSEKQGDGNSNQITTDQSTSGISENENPSLERETLSPKASKNEEESETSNSQDKTQKKPDKILPCPRCNSMDTKFCYYNNYNVNQPRYFCKNCQRYWTAGGTMRNVPVGAGRRKNKNSSSSHFHHLMVPENGLLSHHYMGNNATFLTFGSDSVPSVSQNCHLNGDDHSNKCSNSSEKGGKISLQQQAMKSFMPFPPQLPSFPGLPWPAYSCTPPMIPSVVCPPGFPVSYIPAVPFWGCTVPLPSLNNQNGQDQFTGSSVLGKHSRDGKIIRNSEVSQHEGIVKQKSSEIETEKCVLIPKTLRVDDPKEAAKSSIWCKLGLQTEKTTSINGSRGLFAAFQSKEKEANNMENCLPLEANPAALSRALKFREIA